MKIIAPVFALKEPVSPELEEATGLAIRRVAKAEGHSKGLPSIRSAICGVTHNRPKPKRRIWEEKETIRLMREGAGQSEIAAALGITHSSARRRINKVKDKL